MAVAVRVLALVLAGGQGSELWPLTAHRALPAVPFGGNFRLVDFVLSNLVNAGYRRICVLTQYKSHSLGRHVIMTWQLNQMLGNFVAPVPAQQRLGPRWYTGSADTILQSLNVVFDDPDFVLVFGADHVYRMDPAQMVADHVASGAEATVAGIGLHRTPTAPFGVIDADLTGRITGLHTDGPQRLAGPEVAASYASMGNYVFTTDALVAAVRADAADHDSAHDIAADLLPMFVERGTANVSDFDRNQVPGATDRDHGYWCDVASVDAFHDAHMDLVSVHPTFNLYNEQWPILSVPPALPPAKFVQNGVALDCMVGAGTIISGATAHRSVISGNVNIQAGAAVEGSVLFSGVRIGRNAQVRNAILDKDVVVAAGATIGIDPAATGPPTR